MARQPHERTSEPPVESPRREWSDARHLDGTVEGLVVVPKALVVGSVAWLMNVKERDDEPRPRVVAPHAASGLDVLGVRFRLTEDDHQPQPGDVESDGDHVCRYGAVDPLGLVESALQSAPRFSNPVG